jgi:hypothetical protein
MRDRTDADDIVQGAYNRALLDLILPPMRRAAKDEGYAITVHGSLNRDIDMVAIPWREHGVTDADTLVRRLTGAIGGVTGSCNAREEWTKKPHGRIAKILMVWCGENTGMIDLSVMPAIQPEEND